MKYPKARNYGKCDNVLGTNLLVSNSHIEFKVMDLHNQLAFEIARMSQLHL